MSPKFTYISLGWGVQSWALAAMVALGELPPVDVVIHADTTHKRQETYEFAARWTPWLKAHGVRVITVRAPKKDTAAIQQVNSPSIMLPAFTSYLDGKPSGMLRRQCTGRWKIQPVRRWVSAWLKYGGYKKRPGVIEQWLGITLDEVQRVKPSDVRYIKNRFPFVEDMSPAWTRQRAISWLHANDLEVPIKSSCVFCPYHDKATWRDIKLSTGGDWDRVIEVDRAIRNKRPGYSAYLSSERAPIDGVDFRNERDMGQMGLWDNECEGVCFL